MHQPDRLIRRAVRLPERLGHEYRQNFSGQRRERVFLSSVGFFAAFGIARLLAHRIRDEHHPLNHEPVRRVRVHHLVWGILSLMTVGYLWLVQIGTGDQRSSAWAARLTSLGYEAGSALTLDEFALWLNLRDVYWAREGRESIDAVVLFGSLLSIGIFGGPFLKGGGKEVLRLFGAGEE